jgi:hypothetical protein
MRDILQRAVIVKGRGALYRQAPSQTSGILGLEFEPWDPQSFGRIIASQQDVCSDRPLQFATFVGRSSYLKGATFCIGG